MNADGLSAADSSVFIRGLRKLFSPEKNPGKLLAGYLQPLSGCLHSLLPLFVQLKQMGIQTTKRILLSVHFSPNLIKKIIKNAVVPASGFQDFSGLEIRGRVYVSS